MSMNNLFKVTWQSGFKCRSDSRTSPFYLLSLQITKGFMIDQMANSNEKNSTVFIKKSIYAQYLIWHVYLHNVKHTLLCT